MLQTYLLGMYLIFIFHILVLYFALKISFTIIHIYPLMTNIKILVRKLKVLGTVISVLVSHVFIFCILAG